MKNNINETIQHLSAAMKTLPADVVYAEVKKDIKNALLKIEKVTKKRIKRKETEETVLQKWNQKMSTLVNGNLADPKKSLDAIEKLIELEKNKLQGTAHKPDNNPETLLD